MKPLILTLSFFKAEASDYYTEAITKAVEQMVQTSPIAHFKRPSPRKNSISTQTLSENSSTDESDISSSSDTDDNNGPKHDRDQSKKHGKSGKGLSIQDLQTPLEARVSRKRRKISGQVHPDLVKHFKKKNFPPKSTAVAREQSSLKLRILSLQQQVR